MISKLLNQREIVLDRVVYQNRVLIDDLAEGIVKMALYAKVAHRNSPVFVGSTDSTSEVDFFKAIRRELANNHFKVTNKVIRAKVGAPRLSLSVFPSPNPFFTAAKKSQADIVKRIVNLYRDS